MAPSPHPHLTPEEVSAYLAGQVPESRRSSMEEHLATCDQCRKDLVAASSLGGGRRRGRRATLALIPLAAAAILAAVIFLPQAPPTPAADSGPRLRSQESQAASTITALAPSPGRAVPVSGITFRWNSAGEGAFYKLTVTDPGGEVVWTASTADTALTLSGADAGRLAAGETYFWYVDALLPGARTATTGIQEFATER